MITKEKTDKPRVAYELEKRSGDRAYYQELMFKCVFTPKTNDALLYKIYWYINNSTNPFTTSKILKKGELHLAYLTVDNGLNTITLGIQVKHILCHYMSFLCIQIIPCPICLRICVGFVVFVVVFCCCVERNGIRLNIAIVHLAQVTRFCFKRRIKHFPCPGKMYFKMDRAKFINTSYGISSNEKAKLTISDQSQ